jgi:hypothetical protein
LRSTPFIRLHLAVLAMFLPVVAQLSSSSYAATPLMKVKKTISLLESGEPTGSRPLFQNGYFIYVRKTVHDAGVADVMLYDQTGLGAAQIAVQPPGAKRLLISSAAILAARTVVVSGWYLTGDGTPSTAFLGTVSFRSKVQAITKTGTYVVTQLVTATDGSIWTLGAVRPSDSPLGVRWENYKSLRHFDADLNSLGSYLSRWDEDVSYVIRRPTSSGSYVLDSYRGDNMLLRSYSGPFWGPHAAFATIGSRSPGAWLRPTSTGGIILFDARTGSLFSWEPGHPTLSRESVAVPDPRRIVINGVVVTNSGELFASALQPDATGFRASKFYRLERQSGGLSEWQPVEMTEDKSSARTKSFLVLGVDDDSLVYRVRAGVVSWARTN